VRLFAAACATQRRDDVARCLADTTDPRGLKRE
jgi:hypothetical protein